MRQYRIFLRTVRSEAQQSERRLGITRAREAIALAGRVRPDSIPGDPHLAARRFVRLFFEAQKAMPAA